MRTTGLVWGFAALAPLVAVAVAIAQHNEDHTASPKPIERPTITAVMDVEYVLRNHIRLEQQLTGLLRESEEVAQHIAEQQAVIDAKRKALMARGASTPDFDRLSADVAELEEMNRAAAEAKRISFRQRESQMYVNAYQDIRQNVREFCHDKGISLVLAYNRDLRFDGSPDEIERTIRENRVVDQVGLDISEDVLTAINADITDDVKQSVSRASIFLRPMAELRATGLTLPFHRTLERFGNWNR